MRAKKSLGQHFLRDRSALERIAAAAEITPGERVVEVGPGRGALTAELLERGAAVTAVEKDEELVRDLSERLAAAVESGQLELITGDITDYKPPLEPYKLVANIPYYLTGAIIRQFLTAANQPRRAVLLLQREVAERAAAKDGLGRNGPGQKGRESLLSISVQVYGRPRLVGRVKRGAFTPVPKVDSAILVIEDISRDFFSDIDEVSFFTLLRAGFAEKRKQLLPKLGRRWPEVDWETAFNNCHLKLTARAEEVKAEQWRCLALNRLVPH